MEQTVEDKQEGEDSKKVNGYFYRTGGVDVPQQASGERGARFEGELASTMAFFSLITNLSMLPFRESEGLW